MVMVRKGGATAEFVYGLGLSSLQPSSQVANHEETPLRFVSVQLQLADSSKNLDVDVHAFLFEADGTYVDCVFYKNPTLAGKSVRLLQQDQELLVDLRYIPQRCSFIVCTLAIYSGGTVAQLGDGSVQLSALVPRLGLGENADFPHLPCGQIPPGSSEFYEWVCLGMLPLRPRSSLGEECGMMLCLLAHHAGFWYFKPVLKPVTAFTPQGLIEPAQDYVTRHVAGLSEGTPGIELGSLIKAAREGTHVQFELADTEERHAEEVAGLHALGAPDSGPLKGTVFEIGGAVGSELGNDNPDIYSAAGSGARRPTQGDGKLTWHGSEQQARGPVSKETLRDRLLTGDQGDVVAGKINGRRRAPLLRAAADSSLDGIAAQAHVRKRLQGHTMTGRRGSSDSDQFRQNDLEPSDMEQHPDDGGGRRGKTRQREAADTSQVEEHSEGSSKNQRTTVARDSDVIWDAVSGKHIGIEGGANRLYPKSRSDDRLTGNRGSDDGVPFPVMHHPINEYEEKPLHGIYAHEGQDAAGMNDAWRESVERRLSALERSVGSIGRNLQMIAAATSEMQNNNKLYIQELRARFTELKSDVASDIESALSGPIKTLSLKVEETKDEGGADAERLEEQQRKLRAVDRMVLLHERNWHLLAQSISEIRFQLSGLEQRIDQAVPAVRDSTVPPTDHAKGLPLSLQSSAFINHVEDPHDKEILETSEATQNNEASAPQGPGQSVFASKALEELSRIQSHAEAFGACMRRLASGTAPDGLKGLTPVERRVLAFAGTPKAFAALHDLERALETINLCGPATPGTKLY